MRLHVRLAPPLLTFLAALPLPARGLDIQAHRGGRGLAAENSLAAFRNAIELGVPTIELDLQATPDGELKVAHDPDDDLARAPTFDEALALCRRAPYDVRVSAEIKRHRNASGFDDVEVARRVVEAIRNAGLESRAMVQSFDPAMLAIVSELAPGLPTAQLVRDRDEAERALRVSGASILSPRRDALRRQDVEHLHALGIAVIPWVVNDPADARELVAWGVDGLITDRPDLLMSALSLPGGRASSEEEPMILKSLAAPVLAASLSAPVAAPPPVLAQLPAAAPPAERALDLEDIRRVAVYPFTSGGNVDTFCTSLFVQEALRRDVFADIIDSYELSVTTADGQPFQPQPMIPQLLLEARAKGADAILIGEGKWYDWGFRMELRLLEVKEGRVAWQCAVASGFHFSGPSAKKELVRKAVRGILRDRGSAASLPDGIRRPGSGEARPEHGPGQQDERVRHTVRRGAGQPGGLVPS